ncbi:ABC transporter ATP-binding protein [Clostridium minihomine]|uniref:ABC transporter ATP-binding protein n=1 Tax=Clostridium minihomine TaxID=2045012 RepID=UPI000C787EA5|nr:ABC transporter ATP-binding protein [Clostridium minihomine]
MKKNKKGIENIKRSISLIQLQDKKFLFMSLVTTVLLSLFPVCSLLIMQSIINYIQIGTLDMKLIAILVLFYIAIDIIQTIVQVIWQQYNLKFSLNFKLYIETLLQKKIKNMNLSDYETSEIYDQLQLAQSQNGTQLLETINLLIQLIGSITGIVSHILILIHFKAWIIVVIMILPAVKYIVTNQLNQEQYDIVTSRATGARKIWYWNYLITSGRHFKELTVYHLFDFFIQKYRKESEKFNGQDIKLSKKRNLFLTILTVIEILINGLVFSFIIYSGYIGVILIGNIITYTRSIIATKSGVDTSLNTISTIKQSSLYINLFFEFLDLPSKEMGDKNLQIIKKIDSIEVRNLSFRYKGKSQYTIKNMSFTLKRDQLTVIVGENGAGKTTLAKILIGFYDEYEGEIYINGVDLKQINKEEYMALIATVFQDFTQYEATVKENIGYGNLKAIDEEDRIKEVQAVFQSNFLPLHAQIGNWFDDGTQISMGQWQKIALSRAFLKDADLYLLDEPNAALDPISEFEIAQLYHKILKNKLGIIIAHKFNHFIFNADNILVIEDGEIKEQGTHEELLQNKNKYYELFSVQSETGKNHVL